MVFGRDRFYVRASVKGDGMFLISDSNDLGVFEVKYTYGKPLERVNALLANRRLAGNDPGLLRKSDSDLIESSCRDLARSAAQIDVLVDALAEMRSRTQSMAYPREFVIPSAFSDVFSRLKDPLLPDLGGMTREQAFKLGTWWGERSSDERREFLASYGVWCARARWMRASR
jgi:hypothetical protein